MNTSTCLSIPSPAGTPRNSTSLNVWTMSFRIELMRHRHRYAFVELETDEQADRAIRELNGTDLLGRPVKIGPGVASKKAAYGQFNNSQHAKPAFERWVRTDAADHWKGYSEQKRRLHVGGLPRMPNHHTVDAEVRDLFRGFTM